MTVLFYEIDVKKYSQNISGYSYTRVWMCGRAERLGPVALMQVHNAEDNMPELGEEIKLNKKTQ